MANKVIGPREMEMTCTLCHHEPTQAYSARMALEQSRRTLRRLDNELQKNMKVQTADLGTQRKNYDALMDRFHDLLLEWHTFNMARVLSMAQELTRQASADYTKLKTRKP
jgi:nitric oxide synthase oxygenase domain/subunit